MFSIPFRRDLPIEKNVEAISKTYKECKEQKGKI